MREPPVDVAAVFSRTSDPSLASPTLFELLVSVTLFGAFFFTSTAIASEFLLPLLLGYMKT